MEMYSGMVIPTLQMQVSNAQRIKQEVDKCKSDLNHSWIAPEMVYVNQTLDEMFYKSDRLSAAIGDLIVDIRIAMAEIAEEAAAATAAAAVAAEINAS